MGKILLSADIHLSPHPDHEYRWKAMEQLAQHAQKDDIAAVVIAGDLPNEKDRHPAAFVNRLVYSVRNISDSGKPVIVLEGNHDYINAACPFFKFLNEILGVTYVIEPEHIRIQGKSVLFIPHMKTWGTSKYNWRKKLPLDAGYNVIICHQTFKGAKASNGFELEGVPLLTVDVKNTGGTRVLAGDIHVPQNIGNVTYIGSPHPVSFGDSFQPGFLLWDLEKQEYSRIKRSTIRRMVVNAEAGELLPAKDEPREGDHVKFRYHGDRSEAVTWPELRKGYLDQAEEIGFKVFSTEFVTKKETMPKIKRKMFDEELETPESDNDEFELFCQQSDVPKEYVAIGRELLND